MRKWLIGTVAAAVVATPAAAQIYIGIGRSPYYGYSPYSYGYSPYSYGYSRSYSYPGYGYSYPSYGYSSYAYPYSGYSYGYPYSNYSYGYGYSSGLNNPCLRKHHRNGIVYYTRVC